MIKLNAHWLVLIFLTLLHVVIFWQVLLSAPAVFSGQEVVVRDELVPFFDWQSQFWDQLTIAGESSLTKTEEVRVGYSFWMSWVRYAPILPLSLFLVSIASAFILYLSTYYLTSPLVRMSDRIVAFVALWASLPIHIVLLYSKVTHFYTLVIGFSIFALALSLLIRWYFFSSEPNKLKQPLIIALLVLFNPAIHYHVLFYLVLLFLVIYHLGLGTMLKRPFWKSVAVIFVVSLVPYVFLILYILSLSQLDVANSIPVNYLSIFFASSPILQILSLDIAAQTDMFFYGDYLVKEPRTIKIIWFMAASIGAYFGFMLTKQYKKFMYFLMTLALVSLWMSIGYLYVFSFHSLLAGVNSILLSSNNVIAEFMQQITTTVIQILRFPHRFLFMFYYALAAMAAVSAVLHLDYFRSQVKKTKFYILITILPFISLAPLLFSPDYRTTLLSGDFAGFLSTTDIHIELEEISSVLP